MKLNQYYLICSILGRSGTTFIRNQLGKLDNTVCLTTDAQIKILDQFFSLQKASKVDINKVIEKFKSQEIKNKFAIKKNCSLFDSADSFFYKLPLWVIIERSSLEYTNSLLPIFIIRHPVAIVLSTSHKNFVNKSQPRDELLSLILKTYTHFDLSYDEESIKNFKGLDRLYQNAVLVKLSLKLYRHYFSTIKHGKVLFLSFEHLSTCPKDNIKLLSQFTHCNNDEFLEKNNMPFYQDVIEEGGINMSSILDNTRTFKRYEEVSSKVLAEIYSIVREECITLGYSDSYSEFPQSKIIDMS